MGETRAAGRPRLVTDPTGVGPIIETGWLPFGAMTSPAERTRWEYLTAPLLIHNTKAILDNFGRDGWELVSVTAGANPEQLVAWFKRPVQDS